MAILERTPPRKWQENGTHGRPSEGEGWLHSGQRHDDRPAVGQSSSTVDDTAAAQMPLSSDKHAADNTYVFPSLEDMAARQQKQQQHPQRSARPSATDSRRVAPSVHASSSVSPAVSRPVRAPASGIPRPSHSPNRSNAVRQVKKTERLVHSPQGKASLSPAMAATNTLSQSPSLPARLPKSPQKPVVSMVDQAFQDQIDRAIASGQNPFMDRRRAAMRDDTDTSSMSTNTPHAFQSFQQQQQQPARYSSASDVATTSRVTLPTVENDYVTRQETHVTAEKQDYERASATLRKSLLSNDRPSPSQPPMQAPLPRPVTPERTERRADSPPLVTFTPRRKTISSTDNTAPQIVSLAQQEELHNLRAEVRDVKTQLRAAQLNEEDCVRKANEWKSSLEQEQQRATALENDLAHLQSRYSSLNLAHKAAKYDAMQKLMQEQMTNQESKRQREIESAIARNEITYLNARRIEAQEKLEQFKGKQEYCGREWKEELATLQVEVEQERAEKKQLSAKQKQHERQLTDLQEQCDALEKDVQRESSRRKEIASREQRLRAEVDELQDVLERESSLRKQVVELKASLASANEKWEEERGKVRQLQQSSRSDKIDEKATSSSRKAASSSSVVFSKRVASRLAMQQEVESSFVEEQQQLRQTSPDPPSPAPAPRKQAKKSSKEATEEVIDSVPPTRSTRSRPAKNSTEARKTSKAKKTKEIVEMQEDGDEQDERPPSQPAAKQVKRKEVQEDSVHLESEPLTDDAASTKKVKSIVPAKKSSQSSSKLLSRTVGSSNAGAATTRQGRPKRDTSNGSKETESELAPPSTAAYDETMKTPLLPTKRTRMIMNQKPSSGAAEADDDDDDDRVDERVQKPRKSLDVTMATPMVRIEEPQKKKKRKLLKAGANVAGDFLTWKGDAEGTLAPQLNLPIELSPLKPGEGAIAASGKSSMLRLGTTSSAAPSLFRRN